MPSLEDQRFARIASEKGYVTAEQVQAAMRVQEEALAQGMVKSLSEALSVQGVLSVTQVAEVNDAVKAAGPMTLGDFEIIKKLGEGGMGVVYHARQISLDREVALKLLPAHLARDPNVVARFVREARVSARLDHPNIVRGLAVGEEGGQHFFAMEFIDGTNVGEAIEESGPMEIRRACEIIHQVCEALAIAHKAGIIHRDIKPENIMLTSAGVAKLADLGLVKQSDADVTRLTVSSGGMGTPAYMPPEQARAAKHVDARSDIYALGATFYHMLTGELPYKGESMYEMLQAHEQGRLKAPRALRPEIPSGLSLIVEKMMARKPENRFQSVEEALEALDRVLGKGAAAVEPASAPAAPAAPAGKADRMWHVRVKGKDGKELRYTANTKNLRAFIRKGTIPLTALARCGQSGPWRPISEYKNLHDESRWGEQRGMRGTSALKQMYGKIETSTQRRKRMKQIKKVIKTIVILLVIAGIAIAGFAFKDQIIDWVKGLRG